MSAGNKLVEENDIVDPAMDISRNLARNLASNHGLTLNGETSLSGSGDVDDIVALAGGSDYALDVATNGWSYIYDGFKFDDYYVGYSSKLRLIDVRSGEVVSSGFCGYDAKEAGKETVSHDTLVADNAAYLKQELTDAMIHCVQEFEGNLFAAPAVADSSH